ncbi:MAG: NAD-dependent epimerase/dehydratase family protein [Polyangiaceae bacterium]
MKVIVTGATGMVGEGVLLACLASAAVDAVLSVSRRPCGHTHPKLEELLVPDFRKLGDVEPRLAGYDACFYCAGVSSVGMSEADYTVATYDTTVAFATTLARLNPGMVMTYVSGARTDGTEQGSLMWARVKGRTENALAKLGLRAVYSFRPGLMKPVAGQKNLKRSYRMMLPLLPVASLFLPTLTLGDVGKAMIRCAQLGPPGRVLEVKDIAALAKG